MGDSNFPAYVVKEKTKGAQIYLFKSLYADFCRLQFSHITDKPFAIAGLEQRLTKRFADSSGAGVFGRHVGRCLLWRRANEVKRLKRIHFQTTNPENHTPPSWSFMAYVGSITYIDVPGRTVNWENLDLRLTGSSRSTWLYATDPLVFHAKALDFEENSQEYGKDWSIVYDNPDEDRANDKCVVIGRVGEVLRYILVVRPTGKEGRMVAEYERAGAGYIPFGWIKAKSTAIDIV